MEAAQRRLTKVERAEVIIITIRRVMLALRGRGVAGVDGASIVVIAGVSGEDALANRRVAHPRCTWVIVFTVQRSRRTKTTGWVTGVLGTAIVVVTVCWCVHARCRDWFTDVDGAGVPVITVPIGETALACLGDTLFGGTAIAVIARLRLMDATTHHQVTNIRRAGIIVVA